MIPRYDRPELSQIWTEQGRYEAFLDVELAILKALEGDKVPVGVAENIRKKSKVNVDRINEIEKTTRHDVIAFCTSITENLSAEEGKYFHFGVTSSDIIDSAMTLQLKHSLDLIFPAFKRLLNELHSRAVEMKDIATMGRSHGMYAEPMSFGQKLLGHYNEFARRYQDLVEFYNEELTIQFSGAVGNYTILTPELEQKAADSLQLKVEPLSTQVIPRDRVAKLVNINALCAAAIERLCVEIRHLHHSDIAELHEGFKKGQKGSSTMPHKKNPISGENLTGMARMLKSHVSIALENIVLWHERDISHSSTERMYLPDNLGVLLYSLDRLADTVRDLVFHNDVIEQKVKGQNSYLSSYYLHKLIELTDVKREELYYWVQEASFAGGQTNDPKAIREKIISLSKEAGYELDLPVPTFEEIKNIFLKHSDSVFSRSLKIYPLVE
tara:strand:- start:62311 stop:63630 length:1320 start_codon:yes stop_codon:yes gene_type:complete